MDESRDHAPSQADATGRKTPFTSAAASEYDSIARGKSTKRLDCGHAENSAGLVLLVSMSPVNSLVARRSVSRFASTDDGPCCSTTHSQPGFRTSPLALPLTQ